MNRYRIVIRNYASGRQSFVIQIRRSWRPWWSDFTSRSTLDDAKTAAAAYARSDADYVLIGETVVAEGKPARTGVGRAVVTDFAEPPTA